MADRRSESKESRLDDMDFEELRSKVHTMFYDELHKNMELAVACACYEEIMSDKDYISQIPGNDRYFINDRWFL